MKPSNYSFLLYSITSYFCSRWGAKDQLDKLSATMSRDALWMQSNPVASALFAWYAPLLREGWEDHDVEEVVKFRRRLGISSVCPPQDNIPKQACPYSTPGSTITGVWRYRRNPVRVGSYNVLAIIDGSAIERRVDMWDGLRWDQYDVIAVGDRVEEREDRDTTRLCVVEDFRG